MIMGTIFFHYNFTLEAIVCGSISHKGSWRNTKEFYKLDGKEKKASLNGLQTSPSFSFHPLFATCESIGYTHRVNQTMPGNHSHWSLAWQWPDLWEGSQTFPVLRDQPGRDHSQWAVWAQTPCVGGGGGWKTMTQAILDTSHSLPLSFSKEWSPANSLK